MREKNVNKLRECLYWICIFIFTIIVSLGFTVLTGCSIEGVPYSTATENTGYSTPIENTDLYVYAASDASITREDAALILAEQYMNDMMQPSNKRSFRITKFRDLNVRLYSTVEMEEETARIYNLQLSEINVYTWIVEIEVEFQYEGTISPIGRVQNQWISGLYQSSPIGFLLTQNGTEYTMQSRYITANCN